MKKFEAYLAQAKSDLGVFDVLLQSQVEDCHIVHYLQMSTEKLAKAVICRQLGSNKKSHIAFSKLFKMLDNQLYAECLGYEGKFDSYRCAIRKFETLALGIERSCPAVASRSEDMPNAEYPWLLPNKVKWQAPCFSRFQLADDIRGHTHARQMLHFLRKLADRFHEIF